MCKNKRKKKEEKSICEMLMEEIARIHKEGTNWNEKIEKAFQYFLKKDGPLTTALVLWGSKDPTAIERRRQLFAGIPDGKTKTKHNFLGE